MKDNWSDEKFAADWDNDAAVNNPMRNKLLSLLVTIVADNYNAGDKILDLGFGSGQVEKMIFDRLPDAEVTGVDASETMIKMAKERVPQSNLIAIKHDLTEIGRLNLAKDQYKFAITSFCLHEIPAPHKKEIFKFIYDSLTAGGIYILVDRFKIDIEFLKGAYRSQWKWQSENANTDWSDWKEQFEDYTKRMNSKDDSPDTTEDQLKWLREKGFAAACFQLQFDRGLIVGIKK
ncbi:MAG: class I SAM-dependent methyltransferase [Candidatus Doudnabacteria bacterium]|nr:class I SAM-dependent methyltransferase [Candidatus Doudnabacteria bacterium]